MFANRLKSANNKTVNKVCSLNLTLITGVAYKFHNMWTTLKNALYYVYFVKARVYSGNLFETLLGRTYGSIQHEHLEKHGPHAVSLKQRYSSSSQY